MSDTWLTNAPDERHIAFSSHLLRECFTKEEYIIERFWLETCSMRAKNQAQRAEIPLSLH